MQISLPKSSGNVYSFYVKKSKKIGFKHILTITITIMVLLLIIFTPLDNDYNSDYFNAKSYYMVSMYETQNFSQVETLQLQVEDLGGAGYAYQGKDRYYVIARSYLKKEDAESVVDKNSEGFSSCSIIEVKSSKIKKNNKRLIKQNQFLFEAYKFISDLPTQLYNLSLNYDNGKLTKSEAYKQMVSMKTRIDELLKKVAGEASMHSDFRLIVNEVIDYLTICKEDIDFSLYEQYHGDPVDLSLKLVGVKLCLNEIALKKAINNI